MKKIKILAIGLLVASSYNCKEVKKDIKKGTDEIEAAANEVKEEMKENIDKIEAAANKMKEKMRVETITFSMEPKSDSAVKGEVMFSEINGTVKMMAILSGLTEGEHAIHIHDKADCSSADGKSTGGHWNPTSTPHGKWGAVEGYHKGDIGNFIADAKGNASVTFSTDQWCIGCGDETKNIIGKGVIVHQGIDDFTSQPSGAAGSRVSCAGIIQ